MNRELFKPDQDDIFFANSIEEAYDGLWDEFGGLDLDLKISKQMVKMLPENSPIHKWHSDRISYLNDLLDKNFSK